MSDALYAEAFAAIRRANDGRVSAESLHRAFTDCWRHPLDSVAHKYGFSDAMLRAGWAVFAAIEVTQPMQGYGDLGVLKELPGALFLVTSGFRRLQESKVRALGLAQYFAGIHIDVLDAPDRPGKQKLFEEILAASHFTPAEVLVIGDNPEAEIAAGNRLGIRTVQTLRPGVVRGANATFYIHSLVELTGIAGAG